MLVNLWMVVEAGGGYDGRLEEWYVVVVMVV